VVLAARATREAPAQPVAESADRTELEQAAA
jgi:hypothetical protein